MDAMRRRSPRCARAGRSRRSARSSPRPCTRSSSRWSTRRPPSSSPSTRRTGDEVVVALGVGPGGRGADRGAVGADRCVATRMAVRGGRYTGEIELYLYGEQKAQAARDARRRARLRPGGLPRVLGLDHRPAAARGGRAPDGGQPRPRPAPGRRGAGLADPHLRRPGGAASADTAGGCGGRRRRAGCGAGRGGVVRPSAVRRRADDSVTPVAEPVHPTGGLAAGPRGDYKVVTDFWSARGGAAEKHPSPPVRAPCARTGPSTRSTPREACRRGPAYRDAGRRGHNTTRSARWIPGPRT